MCVTSQKPFIAAGHLLQINKKTCRKIITVPILSKLANSSFKVTINCSAVHLEESSVNPTMSAKRMLMKNAKLNFVRV